MLSGKEYPVSMWWLVMEWYRWKVTSVIAPNLDPLRYESKETRRTIAIRSRPLSKDVVVALKDV